MEARRRARLNGVLVLIVVVALIVVLSLASFTSSGTTSYTTNGTTSHSTSGTTCLGCSSTSTIVSATNTSSSSEASTTGTQTSSASIWIQADLLDSYGTWTIPSETPASVISAVSTLASSVGRGINLEGVMRNIQTNNLSIGDGYTVDSFLTSLRAAAGGGHIIPELNLDIYTFVQGGGSPTAYCNPHNREDCGPRFFYETSNEYLSLQAISSDPGRAVLLDSWPTFARNATSCALAPQILQNLTKSGWTHIMIKQIGPQYFTCGTPSVPPSYVWGQVANVQSQSGSPYMVPETNILSQIPEGQTPLLYFDRQNKAVASEETSLQVFLSSLNPTQQFQALTNLAQSQTQGYIFEFPVFTYTTFVGTNYQWDANKNLQANGQPFLNLIESLILAYE